MAQFVEEFEDDEKNELEGPPPGMEGHVGSQVEYFAPVPTEEPELKKSGSLLPEVMEPPRAISEVQAPKGALPKNNKSKSSMKGEVPEIEEATKGGCDCTIF